MVILLKSCISNETNKFISIFVDNVGMLEYLVPFVLRLRKMLYVGESRERGKTFKKLGLVALNFKHLSLKLKNLATTLNISIIRVCNGLFQTMKSSSVLEVYFRGE